MLLSSLLAVMRAEPQMRSRCASTEDEAKLDALQRAAREAAWQVLAASLEESRRNAERQEERARGALRSLQADLERVASLSEGLRAGQAIVSFVRKWLTL